MIDTLTTNLFLFKVNRDRDKFLLAIEKRRAFRYFVALGICAIICALSWIIG